MFFLITENSSQILRVLFSLYRTQLSSLSPQGSSDKETKDQNKIPPKTTFSLLKSEKIKESESSLEKRHLKPNRLPPAPPALNSVNSARDAASTLNSNFTSCDSLTVAPWSTLSTETGKTCSSVNGRLLGRTAENGTSPSPSCCATTSCDSFSFQHFQAHLRARQSEQGASLHCPQQQTNKQENEEKCMRLGEEVVSLPDPSLPKYNVSASAVVDCNLTPTATSDLQQLPICDRLESSLYARSHSKQHFRTRPKSFYALSHLKSDNSPDHFLLNNHSPSCADLSINTCALERQFEPSNVRQATAKYLSMLSNGAPRPLQLSQRFEAMTFLQASSTQSIVGERKPEAEATNDEIVQIANVSTANENVDKDNKKVCLTFILLSYIKTV